MSLTQTRAKPSFPIRSLRVTVPRYRFSFKHHKTTQNISPPRTSKKSKSIHERGVPFLFPTLFVFPRRQRLGLVLAFFVRFARPAMPLELAVRARVALAAAVLDLAVYAPVALAAVGFAFAVRARVADRTEALEPAMRARVAVRAVSLYFSVCAPLGLGVLFLGHAHQRGDGFARLALVLHLTVRTPDALRAVAPELAVRARIAHGAVLLQLPMRAPVALYALALLLAVRTRGAYRASVLKLVVRTLLPLHGARRPAAPRDLDEFSRTREIWQKSWRFEVLLLKPFKRNFRDSRLRPQRARVSVARTFARHSSARTGVDPWSTVARRISWSRPWYTWCAESSRFFP